ncbi:MAG: enolase C-terminal domain-like protein [Armatimonadota bacterium]
MKPAILHAEVQFIERPFRVPLQLSTGAITAITEAQAAVTVRVGGREVTGQGTIYLSDLWSWPKAPLDHAGRDAVLRRVCEEIADRLTALCGGEAEHPLELGLRLHHAVAHEAFALPADPPVLARAMCASPFDAAIHDAAGIALGRSAFDFYTEPAAIPSADGLFPGEGACTAIAQILEPPCAKLDAWWIVGAHEKLDDEVAHAIRNYDYRCFKQKTTGDTAADAARTAEIYRAVRGYGVEHPRFDVDSNEANPDPASVLDYLERLRALDAEAYDALAYLEQPTSRDIVAHRFDWRPVTALKPVLIDEGLTDFASFEEARAQGWSGFALKTCKGHSFALTAAAWARKHGMLLALQDLTNPGLSAIHAALFAAHVPTMNGVELNSMQYTPAANRDWLTQLAGLFYPRDGRHDVAGVIGKPGLGSCL